jgi:hypothetical protein
MFNFSAKISPLARQPILMHKNKYPCGVFVFCAAHARAKMDSNLFAFGELCEAFYTPPRSLSII